MPRNSSLQSGKEYNIPAQISPRQEKISVCCTAFLNVYGLLHPGYDMSLGPQVGKGCPNPFGIEGAIHPSSPIL